MPPNSLSSSLSSHASIRSRSRARQRKIRCWSGNFRFRPAGARSKMPLSWATSRAVALAAVWWKWKKFGAAWTLPNWPGAPYETRRFFRARAWPEGFGPGGSIRRKTKRGRRRGQLSLPSARGPRPAGRRMRRSRRKRIAKQECKMRAGSFVVADALGRTTHESIEGNPVAEGAIASFGFIMICKSKASLRTRKS